MASPSRKEILRLVLVYLEAERNLKDQTYKCGVSVKTLGDMLESRDRLLTLIQNEFPDEAESIRESYRRSSTS